MLTTGRRICTYTSQSLVLMLQVETYLSRSYIFFCHVLGILWCLFGTAVLLMLDTLKLWDDDPGAPMAPFCSGRRLATRMARTSPTRSTTTPAPASAPRRIPQWNAWSSASRISDVWTFWGWDLLTHGGRLERSDFWRSRVWVRWSAVTSTKDTPKNVMGPRRGGLPS